MPDYKVKTLYSQGKKGKMSDTLAAVITGDVIGSSGITGERRKKLFACLGEAIKNKDAMPGDFKPEIFQGDSFQGFTSINVKKALNASLYIILKMMSEGFGIRVSLGIGDISFDSGESLTSDGTAFQLSGRNMEALKKNNDIIAIATGNEPLNDEWQVHATSLNFLLKRCTESQADAVVQMLLQKTQQEAADSLNIKQPAVQQRLQAAGWPLMQTIIERFELQFYI